MHDDDANTPKVLDWVNELRAERKMGAPLKELPRGIPGESTCCPIANALDNTADVDPAAIVFIDEADGFMPPDFVAKWIHHFDLGWLPEFIIRYDENGEEIA